MSRAHEKVVDAQFGPRAKAYVESAVHSAGQDLDALRRWYERQHRRTRSISAAAADTSPPAWPGMPSG